MDEIKDHYATLGVLPSAQDYLIQAACVALVNRYRRKGWTQEPEVAFKQLTAINEAYDVLRDPVRRLAYDTAYTAIHEHNLVNDQAESVFDVALADLESQWLMASNTYPDLKPIRSGLRQRSCCLEFSFVVILLQERRFRDRVQIAEQLQSEFLDIYFGTDRPLGSSTPNHNTSSRAGHRLGGQLAG